MCSQRRDLAENWNINIATELKEYLEELDSITYAVDGKRLNFGEGDINTTSSLTFGSCTIDTRFCWCLQQES